LQILKNIRVNNSKMKFKIYLINANLNDFELKMF